MAGKRPYKPRVIGDYEFDEVASAMQKMIRRGKEYDAVFWAYVLHQSGYGQYIFRRLTIICSEDIGNGEPMAIVVLNSLHQSWLQNVATDILKMDKNWCSFYCNWITYPMEIFILFGSGIVLINKKIGVLAQAVVLALFIWTAMFLYDYFIFD